MLESWNDGPTKSAIVDFVDRVNNEVASEERVAVFDNDGTLWVEKPAYVQLDFLVRRLAEQAAADPSLADRQPYRAAAAGDLGWFGDAVTKHYNGDDSAIKVVAGGILSAYLGSTVDEHAARIGTFFDQATHPTLNRPYTACGYRPMVELLRYLQDNGFTNYIVSGGGRDFMRPVTTAMYGVPPERVVGTAVGLDFADGQLRMNSTLEILDDGPTKAVQIWDRVGRRPIFAAGNSNGDIEMMQYATAGRHPSMCLLVRHDDADREFDYTAGAEKVIDEAAQRGWTVASIRDDWNTVFAG
ncbi:HAD family hydrolase [Mycobacterium vicinigordonae]|uniref:Haloacid dehalogenase-like hydrolase n=1 Tax=Mycobacterium vicinigordonae TaxID=1719132 RepID=A0A7D6DWM4_9MYCO|nr:HAD family hydrolase [Mycobacterium vicinigordonae]QLL05630.1 haloacid dehalogenase-like hydrolase [Mycobacterium vicinigordonae]